MQNARAPVPVVQIEAGRPGCDPASSVVACVAMNRVIRLALLQTVLFVSVVFFFYVAAYGVRAIFSDDISTGGATYIFAAASLVAKVS